MPYPLTAFGYPIADLNKPPDAMRPRTHWCLECFCTQFEIPSEPCWQCDGTVLTDKLSPNLWHINGPRMSPPFPEEPLVPSP